MGFLFKFKKGKSHQHRAIYEDVMTKHIPMHDTQFPVDSKHCVRICCYALYTSNKRQISQFYLIYSNIAVVEFDSIVTPIIRFCQKCIRIISQYIYDRVSY